MAVLRDFCCRAHGNFESMEENPECPEGCDTVDRVFLQPVGFRSARTANIDSTLESLAKSHGMTDINNRGGQAAKRQEAQTRKAEEINNYIASKYGHTGWGAVPAGGTLNVQTGKVDGSGPGVAGALSAYGGRADNALAEVREELTPKPILVRHDHENLQVSTAMAPA